jgi:microcystin degradation protein MlrC
VSTAQEGSVQVSHGFSTSSSFTSTTRTGADLLPAAQAPTVSAPARTLRVALASYQQESNSLSPLLAQRQSFEDGGFGDDPEVLRLLGCSGEWAGALEVANEEGDIAPQAVWAAHAVSGGVVPAALHAEILQAMVERLGAAHRRAPLDGVLLILHGSTLSEGLDDVAGATLRAVRDRFGRDLPLVATLDMHANVTPAMLAAADVLVAYHTYPHIDLADTGARGMRALVRLMRGAPPPHAALRRLPLIVPPENGGTGRDDALFAGEPRPAPAADLLPRMHRWEESDPANNAGLFLVQPWLNVPHLGSSVLVYGADAAATNRFADDLAADLWQRRQGFFDFLLLTPREAVAAALAEPAGPIVLADAADSTGSGATADGTALLAALLDFNDRRPAYLSIVDPQVVELCHRRRARHVDTPVGALLDPLRQTPLRLQGEIVWVGEGAFRCEGPQWHGKVFRAGRAACVRAGAGGAIHLVITERPCFVWDPGFYRMAGLDTREAHIVVVKSAGAYRAAFKGIAVRSFAVDGPGASPSNLWRVAPELSRVERPLYPWDVACRYEPTSATVPAAASTSY